MKPAECNWKSERITVHEGYLAMFNFLEHYYGNTKSDEIAGLLGGLSLLADGSPIDPGFKQEWLAAVDKARLAAAKPGTEPL
jgi:hypothetical protein